MSHAFVKNHIHLVFGVKDRRIKVVHKFMPELWSYKLQAFAATRKWPAIGVNGMNGSRPRSFPLAAGDVWPTLSA